MASPETGTSTSNTFGGEYEVFLSFRGPDTRRTFTNSLYHALLHTGIRVFMDDEELRFGERISGNLLRAMDDSKLYIPIFTKNYASSYWCLEELAKMVNTSKEDGNKVVLPIFYDVTPDDVKLNTQSYKDAILELERKMEDRNKKLSSEVINTWQQALKNVGGISGKEWKNYSGDWELVEAVVGEVVVRLETRRRPVTKDLVGMEDQIAAINNLLDIDPGGVRLIGIWGMGGIGKTTLANIIFNQLYSQFRQNCCFLEGVRETANTKGLQMLQEKLLSDVSYSRVASKIDRIDHGFNRIRDTIRNKKMLIVLDDVDKGNQIEKLIPVNSLYPGTTILVTTRDKSVLNIRGSEYTFKDYEMVVLNGEYALKLFSRHAFNDNSPPADYHTFSKSIVSTTGGLPLALEAIGSMLFDEEDRDIWEETQENLMKTPHDDVFGKLEISYNALKPDQQQIFLDVACFFIGKNKTNPMYMWEDCRFSPKLAIKVLIKKCMIKVLDGDRFWMHDQFRDLGRVIAERQHTRLWVEKDIIRELRLTSTKIKESVQDQVQALRLLSPSDRITVTSEEIKRFPHLRFLSLYDVNCQGDFTGCLSELKWISFGNTHRVNGAIPSQQLEATNLLHLENAVVVDLEGLEFTDDVLESLLKVARKLKVLTIDCNKSIRGTHTFPEYSVLVKFCFRYCFISEIDCSIGKLRCLTKLSFWCCVELRKLPEQIGELQNLQHLCLWMCSGLIELPDSVTKLVLLTELNVGYTKITRLPDSIGRLTSLSSINVSGTPIERLPSTVSELSQLRTLKLCGCDGIQELPELPKSLTTLNLISTSLLTVPNFSCLTNLVELVLGSCSNPMARLDIIQPCDLGWIREFSKLSKLYVRYPNVRPFTMQFGSLTLMKELTLSGPDLPTCSHLLPNLIDLTLQGTRGKQVHLDGIPPLTKSRENKVYEQLDVLESSERSRIQDCKSSERSVCLPGEPGCNELQAPELIDHWREAILFPSSLKMLRKFRLWGFTEVQDIQFVSALKSLEEFSIQECSSFKSLGDLSNLKNLTQLALKRCPSLRVVKGIDELEFLRWLEINGCRSMERIFDASSSKIRNECWISIKRSGELLDSGRSANTWESYREKILNGTEQASASETETTDSETEIGGQASDSKTEIEDQASDSEIEATDSETEIEEQAADFKIETPDSETETGDPLQKTNRENEMLLCCCGLLDWVKSCAAVLCIRCIR